MILRIRDSNGNLVEVPGIRGSDGVSPTVSVEAIEGGHRITITDVTGPHTFDVLDGEGGGSDGGTTVTVDGTAVDTFDADTKVDKVTATSGIKVYTSESGKQTTRWASTASSNGYIPIRTSGGNIIVPTTPSSASYAASKSYVDSSMAALKEELGESASTTSTNFIGLVDDLEDCIKYVNLSTTYNPNTREAHITGTVYVEPNGENSDALFEEEKLFEFLGIPGFDPGYEVHGTWFPVGMFEDGLAGYAMPVCVTMHNAVLLEVVVDTGDSRESLYLDDLYSYIDSHTVYIDIRGICYEE